MAFSPIQGPDEQRAARDAALADWLERYGPGLRVFFIRKAGLDEAEDLVQEVFLCLHSRAAYDDIEDVERYLFKIAHNVLASRRRGWSARGRRAQIPLDRLGELPDPLSPERILLGKLDRDTAMVAIRKLPPRTQMAFLLHRFEDMTYPAIARRMGISQNAVRHLMSRALAQISAALEGKQ